MSNQEQVTVSPSTNVPAEDLMYHGDLSDLIGDLDNVINQVDEIDEMMYDGDNVEMYGATSDRLKVIRTKAGDMWGNVKSSLGDFFKKLTTRTNGKLPDWVYGASEGVLQSMITYIEERLSENDGNTNKVSIEMLRQAINALRSRIIDARGLPESVENNKKPEISESDE